MKPGFSSPFEDWVIKEWRRHSEAIDGPAKVKRLLETLKDPKGARERAFAKRRRIPRESGRDSGATAVCKTVTSETQ
jgi:hypothetical protein